MSKTSVICTAILFGLSALAALVLAGLPLLAHAGEADWRPGEALGGRLAVVEGLPILELSGDPATRGRQAAALVGRKGADLLAVMRLNPMAPATDPQRLAAILAATRPGDRAELTAIAEAIGRPVDEVLLANATIETLCSAVAHLPSGRVARNMDFFPPGALGRASVLQIVREPGRRSYAAISWPAMAGVISGMNDAGLSACILLNWKGGDPPPGEPLAFRVRAILQDCGDVASAVAALGAAPVGSRHYVLLADARSAAVAWWTPEGMQVDKPQGDWLVASNWIRENGAPRADDERGGCLLRHCTALGSTAPDATWMRRVLSSSYLVGLNAQAMVLDQRQRRLELAVAHDDLGPATSQSWWSIALGPLLDGAPAGQAQVQRLPPEAQLPHYLLP